ncbi:hypothetical protein LP420_04940 [Massilia sp. B-10]|nr:hypothetical protein LP420_04940 [Massilia sp. B-10]
MTRIWGGGFADIEAPYITRNGGYYYLFVNRGACCKGSNSSYYVEVQRDQHQGAVFGHAHGAGQCGRQPQGAGPRGRAQTGRLPVRLDPLLRHQRRRQRQAAVPQNELQRRLAGAEHRLCQLCLSCGGISDGAYAFKSRLSGKVLTVADAVGRATAPSCSRRATPARSTRAGTWSATATATTASSTPTACAAWTTTAIRPRPGPLICFGKTGQLLS